MTLAADTYATTSTTSASTGAPTRRADRIGRGLSALNAVASLAAFANGVLLVLAAPDATLVVETWRTLGFLVFAGLWALLAIWPRSLPGVWELVLVHKVAVTVLFLSYGAAPDARATGLIDLGVVLTTLIAYALCRGWLSWRNVAAAPAVAPRPAGR